MTTHPEAAPARAELIERLQRAGANPVVGDKEYDPPHDRDKRRLLLEAAEALSLAESRGR